MKPPLWAYVLIASMLALPSGVSAQSLDARTPADLSSRNRSAIEVTRDKILADRKGQLATAMKLTEEEARAFWPIYDEYAREMADISNTGVDLLTQLGDSFKDLSDADATRIANESLIIDQKRIAIRQGYAQRFAAVLPGKKVARFIQLERRLDAVVVLNVAQAISLIE